MSVDIKSWETYLRRSSNNDEIKKNSNNFTSNYRHVYNFHNSIITTSTTPKIDENRIKSKSKSTKLQDFYSEKDALSEEYDNMLAEEKSLPIMRIYNNDARYLEELINVYHFYFDELKSTFKQRPRTLHLAMEYFNQIVMRCPWLQKSEIGIIAASSFLWASKFDEIDYNLPRIEKVKQEMIKSKYFVQYDTDFVRKNFISCEKEIWK